MAWNNIVTSGKSQFLWPLFVWTEENWNFVSPFRLPFVAATATAALGIKRKMRFWSRRQQINSHFNAYTSFHRVIRFCWRSILCVWLSISSDIWNCENNLTAFFRCCRRCLRRRALSFLFCDFGKRFDKFSFLRIEQNVLLYIRLKKWAICVSYAYMARCVFRFNFFAVIISVDDIKSLNKYQFASTDFSLALVA